MRGLGEGPGRRREAGVALGPSAPDRVGRGGRRLPGIRRHGLRRSSAAALTGLALAAVLSSCGGGPAAGSAKTTITLYNGQHPQTTQSLVSAFEKATGINVVVRSDDEDTFDAELVTEGSRSPADVFYTENSPALEYVQQRGLLAPTDPSTLAKIPSRFNSPQGDWVGVSARVSVLTYNPGRISASQLPKKVLDLANPRYRGKLAIAPGETDFQPIVTSVVLAYGKAAAMRWLEGVKANAVGHVYPDNETLSSQVNRGVVAFGLVNQYYWYRMRAEIGAGNTHSKIAYFAPRDPGYVIDVSGAGVLKSSKQKAAAQKFVAFLVSPQGQRIIANSISYEYPVAPGVKDSQHETPFAALQPNSISVAQLGTGSQAVELLRDVQLL